jgi:hypoxanthine phosphoribosyltransferase
VLKGGFIFLADLMREITIPVDMDLIAVSSYGASTRSSGVVRIIKDIDLDIVGKHVLIVEDLVDTGLTLSHLKDLFNTRGPKSVKVCTAFDKPSRRKIEIEIEYNGIEVPDKFIVGYGLDYAGRYRNLPDVCTLKEEIYEKEL